MKKLFLNDLLLFPTPPFMFGITKSNDLNLIFYYYFPGRQMYFLSMNRDYFVVDGCKKKQSSLAGGGTNLRFLVSFSLNLTVLCVSCFSQRLLRYCSFSFEIVKTVSLHRKEIKAVFVTFELAGW